MGYYTRVLSKRSDCPPLEVLVNALRAAHTEAVLSVEDGTPDEWGSLLLAHADGREIAVVERNLVTDGSLGAAEVAELVEEIQDCKPASAVPWLTAFLRSVRAIYAFQHLSGTDTNQGDAALRSVSDAIWSRGDAILQADGEGFSNEQGYHILWQFSDRVSGPWWMAVLEGETWRTFQMDLGDENHRAAFLEGRVAAS